MPTPRLLIGFVRLRRVDNGNRLLGSQIRKQPNLTGIFVEDTVFILIRARRILHCNVIDNNRICRADIVFHSNIAFIRRSRIADSGFLINLQLVNTDCTPRRVAVLCYIQFDISRFDRCIQIAVCNILFIVRHRIRSGKCQCSDPILACRVITGKQRLTVITRILQIEINGVVVHAFARTFAVCVINDPSLDVFFLAKVDNGIAAVSIGTPLTVTDNAVIDQVNRAIRNTRNAGNSGFAKRQILTLFKYRTKPSCTSVGQSISNVFVPPFTPFSE